MPSPSWIRRLLKVPLVFKLAGANALIVIAAFFIASLTAGDTGQATSGILEGALILSLVINILLVTLALRPLHQVEDTARRVWQGDLDARVPDSILADRDIAKVGHTLNLLLDGLTGDRERMRLLAQRLISAGDVERETLARALHDSAAQSLAALAFQASAAAQDASDTALAERLQAVRDLATDVLEEVRELGHTLYPHVLNDLGLPSALRRLARDTVQRAPAVNVNVSVDNAASTGSLPTEVASALYHVAREGVANALRHGNASDIDVEVSVADHTARLTVADNGLGFDVARAEREPPGTGLFGMRERLAIIDGELDITSRSGEGTRLLVTVPLP